MIEKFHPRNQRRSERRRSIRLRSSTLPRRKSEEHQMDVYGGQRRKEGFGFLHSTKPSLYYSELLARSLLLYAEENKIFEFIFQLLLREKFSRISPDSSEKRFISHPIQQAALFDIEGAASIILPENLEGALRRAEWLLARLEEDSLPGSSQTTELLSTWRESTEKVSPDGNPKQIVVGVVVVAIPGVTMGKFHRKKSMSILVRNDLVLQPTLPLVETCIRVSFNVFERAILLARGDMKKLEPEMADWLFGGREFSFYEGNTTRLSFVQSELVRLGIPHSAFEENGIIAALAISPIVDGERISSEWNMDRLVL